MHPGGFELPTARFVAEYSIQLSYGCIGKIYFTADIDIATKAISSKNRAHPGGLLALRLALRAVAKATLSSLAFAVNRHLFDTFIAEDYGEYGASGRIRTSDRSVRSRVLYPAELRMHRETYFTADFLISATKAVSSKRWLSGRITRLAARPSGRC